MRAKHYQEIKLFKLYNKDLSGNEADIQERNDFFDKRLSRLAENDGLIYDANKNPDGILEKYIVKQKNAEGNLVEIHQCDGKISVESEAFAVRTTMILKGRAKNPNYNPNIPIAANNQKDFTVAVERYHKNHRSHKKNEYYLRVLDDHNKPIDLAGDEIPHLDLGHFLTLATTVSAKHNEIDLRSKDMDAKIKYTLNVTEDGTTTPREHNIPAKWLMYAALKAKNYQGKIIVIPSDHTQLSNDTLKNQIATLINYIKGNKPEDAIIHAPRPS